MKRTALACLGLLLAATAAAAEVGHAPPGPQDRCPVCGMFVKGHANWFAGVLFTDGGHHTFDGPKDLFRFLSNVKKYDKKHGDADVKAVYVTDYYSLRPIDAKKALYVTKSDVYGPMGEEFIPFEKAADAAEFLKDHRGKTVLKFSEALAAARTLE